MGSKSRMRAESPDPRAPLLSLLKRYRPSGPHESAMRERIQRFVTENPRCFERSLTSGHLTASAWIINPARTRALLTHHRKLGKWLQLGGHADGEADMLKVALREAHEESGLTRIRPVSEEIFDVDVHSIPGRRGEPEHFHYDVRFLLESDDRQPLRIGDESRSLLWVDFGGVPDYTGEESVLRMLRKSR